MQYNIIYILKNDCQPNSANVILLQSSYRIQRTPWIRVLGFVCVCVCVLSEVWRQYNLTFVSHVWGATALSLLNWKRQRRRQRRRRWLQRPITSFRSGVRGGAKWNGKRRPASSRVQWMWSCRSLGGAEAWCKGWRIIYWTYKLYSRASGQVRRSGVHYITL